MPHAIVRTQTPEEREYSRYLAEVEARKRRAASLQTELTTLKLALGRFESDYHVRVGLLFVELDRVGLAIEEYEHRVARLETAPTADPESVEQEVRAEFADQREQVHQDEEDAQRFERAFERDQARPKLDTDAEDELKQLYRELAKRHHPDLARTAEERREREPLMQRVNAAVRERDLDALRALVREAEVADPTFEARSLGEKLVWAIREVARLDEVIAGLEAELALVQSSDTHRLWQRQEAGERVVEVLEEDVQAELAAKRDQLAALIATYQHLLDQRMA